MFHKLITEPHKKFISAQTSLEYKLTIFYQIVYVLWYWQVLDDFLQIDSIVYGPWLILIEIYIQTMSFDSMQSAAARRNSQILYTTLVNLYPATF